MVAPPLVLPPVEGAPVVPPVVPPVLPDLVAPPLELPVLPPAGAWLMAVKLVVKKAAAIKALISFIFNP